MTDADQKILPSGTPVVLVGLSPLHHYHLDAFLANRQIHPPDTHAGHLMEPYSPGQSVMMRPGPMARNVNARNYRRTMWFNPVLLTRQAGTCAFIDIDKVAPDDSGCSRFLLVEDKGSLVDEIQCADIRWPAQAVFANRIHDYVRSVYRRLSLRTW